MTKRTLLSILTALALFVVLLGVVPTTPVSAGLGFPSFKDSTAATATVISVATIGSQVAVHVVDSDLTGPSTQVTVRSTTDSTGVTLTLNQIAAGAYSALLEIATVTNPTAVPPKLGAASGDTVTALYADQNPGFTTATTITVVASFDADLILTKSDQPDPVTAGGSVTYTLTLTNAGPADATEVSLTDTLPSVVTFLAAFPSQGSCAESGGTVICNLGGLAKDATSTVEIGVRVPLSTPDGTELTNTAAATAAEGDPNTGNNTNIAVVTTVIRPADLSVMKSDSPDPVAVGQNLTYTIVVTNDGPFEAHGVVVTDPIGISTFVSATPSQSSCNESNRTVTCALGTIASAASSTVSIVVTPTQTGPLGNAVSVTADTVDLRLSDNSATANTTVQQAGNGTVSFKSGTSISATDLQSAAFGSQVAVHVVDADLDGATSTTVTVVSDSDPAGLTLTLNAVATDIFSGLFEIAPSTVATAATPKLRAANGDTVITRYADASPAITRADSLLVTGPVFSNLSPADGTKTKATTQILSVEVTDTVSGINRDSIRFIFSTTMATLTPADIRITPSAFTTIKDGFRASIALGLPEGTSWIGAEATDNAGNSASFDADSDNSGDQGNKLTVDRTAPLLRDSFTGVDFDPAKSELLFDKRNKMLVAFGDNLTDLDPASIQASDFAVAGSSVTEATFFDVTFSSSSVAKLGGATVVMRKAVVLSLAADLAPDATPNVFIVGDGVADQAGNILLGTFIAAEDKITPGIAVVSISPQLAGLDEQVDIDITSDEALAARPVVQLFDMRTTSTIKTITATPVGTNSWRVTTDKNTSFTTAINVYVAGSDDNGNKGEVGIKGNADETAEGAVFYEADVSLLTPEVAPPNGSSVAISDPFDIAVDFTIEGNEYNGDTHGTVTLTLFRVDGADRLAEVSTTDNKTFTVAISGISLGEHLVTLNAVDEAGNSLAQDMQVRFTVVETQPPVTPTCGDLNDDGDINILDAIIELQIIVGLITPTETQLTVGNVVRDISINILDAILLLQHIVGLTQITDCGAPVP